MPCTRRVRSRASRVWRGVAGPGVGWHGAARRGTARHSVAWRGVAWRGLAWPGVAWHGVVWLRLRTASSTNLMPPKALPTRTRVHASPCPPPRRSS